MVFPGGKYVADAKWVLQCRLGCSPKVYMLTAGSLVGYGMYTGFFKRWSQMEGD